MYHYVFFPEVNFAVCRLALNKDFLQHFSHILLWVIFDFKQLLQ